jgi:drug/metabolite transporter (DMT)-like permease
MMLPVFVSSLILDQKLTMNYSNFMGILYIGIFSSVLSFLFWNYGVVHIGPNKAGMYMHLMPFFGAILSIWFLGEGLALFHIYGAVFVFTGIFLTNWEQIRKSSQKRPIKVTHKK